MMPSLCLYVFYIRWYILQTSPYHSLLKACNFTSQLSKLLVYVYNFHMLIFVSSITVTCDGPCLATFSLDAFDTHLRI